VYEYPYTNPLQTEVHAFLTSSVNNEKVDPVTLEQLYAAYPDWPSLDPAKRATPRLICQLDPDNFILAPLPDATVNYDLKMIVALKPLRDATGMDKNVFDDLENVIVHCNIYWYCRIKTGQTVSWLRITLGNTFTRPQSVEQGQI
jgi:hypothetical protein